MSRRMAVGGLSVGGLLILALAACGGPPGGTTAKNRELATFEVTAAPDAALSTAEDEQERRRAPALAGALPDGFPPDIPVYRPSSLVDQTILPAGGSVLVFDTQEARDAVVATLGSRLRAQGWRAAQGDVWTKAARRIKISVESRPAGSRIRLEL